MSRVLPLLLLLLLPACASDPVLFSKTIFVDEEVPTAAEVNLAFDSVDRIFETRPVADHEAVADRVRESGERAFGILDLQDDDSLTAPEKTKITPEQAFERMRDHSYRPATFVEAIAFARDEPGQQLVHDILALGSVFESDVGDWIAPALESDEPSPTSDQTVFRVLGRRTPDVTMLESWKFLAILE